MNRSIIPFHTLTVLALAVGVPFFGCNFDTTKSDGSKSVVSPQDDIPGFDQIQTQILTPYCTGCHTSRAPNLTTYESVVANLTAVNEQAVVRRSMPPRKALPEDLRILLQSWIQNGAPRVGTVVNPPTPSPTPSPSMSPAAGSIPRPFTYAELKTRVIQTKCLLCHATDNVDDLTPLDTYKDIMTVAPYIEPLVIGVDGETTTPVDQRMPPKAQPQLTQEEKAYFFLWLNDGKLEK